ncbi:SnoaL-like domain-containing protein [Parasphingorhabdus marina DSM 22363]|uniref:SnoaL-like domain-containing protein n=1 Tax=Parasphingorhabdus marina DSM 22363 TaxID=1123272 RepID=A0A1N6HJH7_9SPHN|nr:nuclear transport factor 2 family protein [Parasphingorhabdus marina]SIO19902.1 SnoaL-like domain-containing protein [Parasphingorhabdus marina DSM 22363]
MPVRKRVEAFVDAVVNGDHGEAIANFYHPDASMQENREPPREGRDQLIVHEQAGMRRIQSMITHQPEAVLVDGDHVAIAWTFDSVGKDGVTRRLHEVALQEWRGDRIARERFVYDSATAWQPVSSPDNSKD